MQILIDSHTHTYASGHAYNTLYEQITKAKQIGLKAICNTDHAEKMPGASSWVHFGNLRALPKEYEGIKIYKGVEANIINEQGDIDVKEIILDRLDFCIASLHDIVVHFDNKEQVTNAILNAMENKYINVIGHLCDPTFPFDLEKVAKKASETNTAIEVNNTSLNPNCYRFDKENTIINFLELCKKYNVRITTGSDSHFLDTLGDLTYAVDILNQVGYPEELVLNTNIHRFEQYFDIK